MDVGWWQFRLWTNELLNLLPIPRNKTITGSDSSLQNQEKDMKQTSRRDEAK